jgi:hypothetical protein
MRTDGNTDMTKVTCFLAILRTRLKIGVLVSYACQDTESYREHGNTVWQNRIVRSIQARSYPFLKIRRSERRRYPGANFPLF